jgi:hypothetical protein
VILTLNATGATGAFMETKAKKKRKKHPEEFKRTPSDHALVNERVLSEIRAIHSEHRELYASPRVRAELRDGAVGPRSRGWGQRRSSPAAN